MSESKTKFGLGYRADYGVAPYLEAAPQLNFLEIVSENYTRGSRKSYKQLEELRATYPIAMHGVGLNIAGPDALSDVYLTELRTLKNRIEPLFVTDHLCWTSFGGHYSYDLLPTGLTRASLKRIAERVQHVQEFLGTSILLENPSVYVSLAQDEMNEADFMAELTRITGCGLLLDVNNLVVNMFNTNQDPIAYIKTLPVGTVRQFHIAGHTIEDALRIDTHDHPMSAEGWDLYRLARNRFPEAATLFEWDANYPEFSYLLEELEKARAIKIDSESCAVTLSQWNERAPERAPASMTQDHHAFYPALWRGIVGSEEDKNHAIQSGWFREDNPVPPALGVSVYHDGYRIRAYESLRDAYEVIHSVLGESFFRRLSDAYLERHPHTDYSMNEIGADFELYLRQNPDEFYFGCSLDLMGDLARFSWAQQKLFTAPREINKPTTLASLQDMPAEGWSTLTLSFISHIHFDRAGWDVLPSWAAVKEGGKPSFPEEGESHYRVWPGEASVLHRATTAEQAVAFAVMSQGGTFEAAIAAVMDAGIEDETEAVQTTVGFVGQWFEDGLVTAVSW